MKVKHKLFFGLLLFGACCISACDKKGECGFGNDADYFVFGSFYGECIGEGCVEMFRVDHATLYEDTLDIYPNSEDFYQGTFTTKWSDEKYQLVKDLIDDFPEQLLDETSVVQGVPDGGDWGGAYFELKRGSTHRFWLLDLNENNMPALYNAFVDKISEKIILIHQ